RKFLEKELEVIAALFAGKGADYLLVDCRSPREYSSAALVFWADIIVSMFHTSTDGLQGAANIHHFVRRARSDEPTAQPSKSVRPRIIPVLCRVPESFSNVGELQAQLKAYWKENLIHSSRRSRPPEKFIVLHEFGGLEENERLLLETKRPSEDSAPQKVKDIDRLLSHDYANLFQQIFAEEKDVAKGIRLSDPKIWNSVLGLKKESIVLESSYPVSAGVMRNRDDEPNVALRAKTVRLLMTTFRKRQTAKVRELGMTPTAVEHWINHNFHEAGYVIGQDFGSELIQPGKVWKVIPRDVRSRLAGWCEFDQRSGFGLMGCKGVSPNG